MAIHNEIEFENDVCDALAAAGWLYDPSDAEDYDRQLALFPAGVVAWVQEADPDGWKALEKNHGSAAASTLCGRLRDSLDQLGTLDVIRGGIDVLGLRSKIKNFHVSC